MAQLKTQAVFPLISIQCGGQEVMIVLLVIANVNKHLLCIRSSDSYPKGKSEV